MRKEKIIEKTLWLLQTDKFERWLSQMEQDGWMLASFVGPSKCTFRKCEPRKRTYLIITRPGYAGGYMKRLYEDILHNHHGFTVSAENSYYGIVRIKTDDQAEINELLARRNKKLSYYFLSETIAIVLFSVFVIGLICIRSLLWILLFIPTIILFFYHFLGTIKFFYYSKRQNESNE